jgi:SPP1 gp7 family putative phage head morphogenesis protein
LGTEEPAVDIPAPPPDVEPVGGADACKILGRSAGWLREAVKRGTIPGAAYRLGGRIVYNPVALREWRDSQMIGHDNGGNATGEPAENPTADDEAERENAEFIEFSEMLRSERIERDTRNQLFALTPATSEAIQKEFAAFVVKNLTNKGTFKSGATFTPSPEIEDAMIAAAMVGVAASFRQFRSQLNSPKNVKFAEGQDRIDEAYDKFQAAVNMSPSELEEWRDGDIAVKASLRPKTVINRVIRLLRKPKSEWTGADATAAMKVHSFVSRMKGNERGENVDAETDYSKRDISLKNWGFNPRKSSMHEAPAEVVTFADASDLPPYWRRGAEWMASRGAVPRSTLNKIIERFFDALDAGIVPDLRVVEAAIRERVLAIAGAVSDSVVAGVRQTIATGVAEGLSAQEIARQLRDAATRGELPGIPRRNIDTIARTEQAGALEAQRAEIERLPLVRSNLLGYRYSNPADSRSRDSHKALDGAFFPLDSPELAALGRSPYSYSCRCLLIPVLRIPGRPVPEKTANLSELVANLERF